MLSRAQNLIQYQLAILILSVFLAGCQDRYDEWPTAEELYEQAGRARQNEDFELAEELARQGLSQQDDQSTVLHWQLRLMLSELLILNRETEEPLQLLSENFPEGSEFQILRGKQFLNRARILLQRRDSGDLEVSLGLLKEAWQIADQLKAAPLLARIQMRKGYQAFWEAYDLDGQLRQKRVSESEEFFRDAMRRAETLGDPDLQATSRGSLSFFLIETFRHFEAIEQFQLSLQQARKAGKKRVEQRIIGNMGWSYYWLGDFPRAKQLLTKAEEMAEDLGILTDQHRWLGNLGAVYYAEKNYSEAIDRFQGAYELLNQLPEKKGLWAARWLHNLATASLRLDRLDQAEQYNRQARELKESLEESERRGTMLYTLLNSADIHIKKQEFDEAESLLLNILQSDADDPALLWEARAVLGGLYARVNKLDEAEVYFEEALQSFDQVRASLKQKDSGLLITFQERRIEYLQSYVDFLMQNGEPERALELVETSRAQVLAEGLGHDPAENGQTVSFQETARDLNTVLLSYWIAPKRSYAWAVTPDGEIRNFELAGEKQVKIAVDSYAQIIQIRDPIKTNSPSGNRIYQTLLQPLRDVFQPQGRVVLVPHGVLHNLSFETIPIPEPEPHYWIEDVTLALASSLALIQPRVKPGNRQASAFLIGFSPKDEPLPGVEKEIDMIGKLLERHGMESESLMQAQASASLFQSPLILESPLIYFGAHAVANRESPLNSYVILSDKLYAHTVASTKLNARLVTVSACQSAGAHSYVGEGLVGFTWAFFYAGAHNVVAGLWNVNDRSSSKLMQEFYANLGRGMDIASALRQAKLTMLASDGPQSRPYHWAPFQIYTHSSPFENLFEPSASVETTDANGH